MQAYTIDWAPGQGHATHCHKHKNCIKYKEKLSSHCLVCWLAINAWYLCRNEVAPRRITSG